MSEKSFTVYILANTYGTVLCTGVTNNLPRRIEEHRQKLIPGFTARYNVNKLVYFEQTNDAQAAIEREKEIKGWTKQKKHSLIQEMNPGWRDLSEES